MSDDGNITIPDVLAAMLDPTERRMHALERDLAATREAYLTNTRERDAAIAERDALRSVLAQVAECRDATDCATCRDAIAEALGPALGEA